MLFRSGYMSPQQARADAGTRPDDIFTLGRVLNVLAEGAEDSSAEARAIRPALQQIIEKCCKEEPIERYRSAADLSDALSECVSGASAGFISQAVAFARSRPKLVAAIAVSIAAVGLSTAIYLNKQHVENTRLNDQKRVAQNLEVQSLPVQIGIERVASPWSEKLPQITERSASFPEQVKLARKLVEAGDAAAKGALGVTYILCRESMLDLQKMRLVKTRADYTPKKEIEDRRHSGKPMSQSEIDKRIDDQIFAEPSVPT